MRRVIKEIRNKTYLRRKRRNLRRLAKRASHFMKSIILRNIIMRNRIKQKRTKEAKKRNRIIIMKIRKKPKMKKKSTRKINKKRMKVRDCVLSEIIILEWLLKILITSHKP